MVYELAADGMIYREADRRLPQKAEYFLTQTGESLRPWLLGICEWGAKLPGVETGQKPSG